MSRESGSFRPGLYVPQAYRLVEAATGQGVAIWRKRNRKNTLRMFREQADFGAGVGIVEPDANAAGHRQTCAVRRPCDRRVAAADATLAQASEGAFWQSPAGIVLRVAILRE